MAAPASNDSVYHIPRYSLLSTRVSDANLEGLKYNHAAPIRVQLTAPDGEAPKEEVDFHKTGGQVHVSGLGGNVSL